MIELDTITINGFKSIAAIGQAKGLRAKREELFPMMNR